MPWLEVEVKTTGRTVLCYLPMYSAENPQPLIVPYIPPTKFEILQAQDSTTSKWLLEKLERSVSFNSVASIEGDAILERDKQDAEKLKRGIEIAIEKGVLQKLDPYPAYARIDVQGKTAKEVADEITRLRDKATGADEWTGGVIVLAGLSGTGKGTTVDILKKMMGKATTWSNGNIFRSLTLLAVTHAMHQGQDFSKAFLTSENISNWMTMLHFEEVDGKFDTRVQGLGHDFYILDIANTVLKGPMVSRNVPTVAEIAQGEVIRFASDACNVMAKAGVSVLLEGREETVNYIDTPHRFELVMSDASLIGKRRAAQMVGAKALEILGQAEDDDAVEKAITDALTGMVTDVDPADTKS